MKKLVSFGIALLFLVSFAYADEVYHSAQYIRLNGDPSHNLSTWRDSGDYTKINAAYLWSLGNVPSGAGTLPAVNIPNLDADKITTGSIDNSVFSAYSDLTAEGYLDNDANGDLLTRTQSDSRFVNEGQADSITSGMVNFNYAASGSEGGAATGLACSGTCVSSGEVDFNYAAGATKGGAATSGDSATAFFSTGTIEDARIASTIARNSEVTEAIATKDECSEITGCVVGAITDGNTGWNNVYGFITSADDTVSGTELDGVFSATGILRRTAAGTYSTITDSSTNWNTAYTHSQNDVDTSATNEYPLAGSGISVSTRTVSHADTSSQASSNNAGRTYIQDVTLDTYGHVTGLATATETVTDTTCAVTDSCSNILYETELDTYA